ncbi:hypothetical protein LDENG_00215670 [Lucifuga dentata]|nr:hypothetical protein LDENG_00215670 [Lucifuga dentata]
MRFCEAESVQQAGNPEQEHPYMWRQRQHAQAAQSESRRFLPKISLSGGRVQLMARPGDTEHLHQAGGSWANSRSAALPSKELNYPPRNSLGHERKEVPSPKRQQSAPSKKERISFRDTRVQLSGGWGGGKKRDKLCKPPRHHDLKSANVKPKGKKEFLSESL